MEPPGAANHLKERRRKGPRSSLGVSAHGEISPTTVRGMLWWEKKRADKRNADRMDGWMDGWRGREEAGGWLRAGKAGGWGGGWWWRGRCNLRQSCPKPPGWKAGDWGGSGEAGPSEHLQHSPSQGQQHLPAPCQSTRGQCGPPVESRAPQEGDHTSIASCRSVDKLETEILSSSIPDSRRGLCCWFCQHTRGLSWWLGHPGPSPWKEWEMVYKGTWAGVWPSPCVQVGAGGTAAFSQVCSAWETNISLPSIILLQKWFYQKHPVQEVISWGNRYKYPNQAELQSSSTGLRTGFTSAWYYYCACN